MLIELDVHANSEHVRMTLPQYNASTVVKNIVAYRQDKAGVGPIVALGESADDLLQQTPAHLRGELADYQYVYPFDVTQFKPDFVEAMLRYYVFKLMPATRAAHWFRLHLLDRLLLTLSIADYESLPLVQRQEFEYGLRKSLNPKLRDLIVNGGSSLSPEFIQAKHRFERQSATADWVLWGLRFMGLAGPFWLLVRIWPGLPSDSEPLRVLIVLALCLAGVTFGDWLALTLWGIVMPRLLPTSTLRTVVAQSNIAKIEKAWLERFLYETT